MAYDNERALETIRLFHDNTMKKSKMVLKDAVKNLAEEMVERTPTFFEDLPESGSTKANWRYSLNSPDTLYDESSVDISGENTKSRLRSEIQSIAIKDNSVLYLTNSSPAMRYLEYGLYPLSPVKGSYNYLTGEYKIRSEGGFSQNATEGIVHVSAMQWGDFVADAQAKYAGPAT